MEPTESKKMGLGSLIAMVVSLQLGSAMFLLPKQMAPYGLWGLVAWIFAGLGALSLCSVFATLSQVDSGTGGPHVYVEKAMGPSMGFYTAWSYWFISWFSSLQLFLLAIYGLEGFIGFSLNQVQRLGIEISLLLFICTLNLRGPSLAGKMEIIFSFFKIVPMIFFPIFLFFHWNPEVMKDLGSQWSFSWGAMKNLCNALVLAFWGFVGLEAGTSVVTWVKNPRRTMPLGLFLGTLVVLGVYIANTCSLFFVFPQNVLINNERPYALVLSTFLGPQWGQWFSLLIFVVITGTLNSWLLASGQVAKGASDRGLLPSYFGLENKKKSPSGGLWITCGALSLSLLFLSFFPVEKQIDLLITSSVCFLLFIYTLCVASLMIFMKRKIVSFSWITLGAAGISFLFSLISLSTSPWHAIALSFFVPFLGWILKRTMKNFHNENYSL